MFFLSIDTFLLEQGRSSLRQGSGQKEHQQQKIQKLRFEQTSKAGGQIDAHLIIYASYAINA